MKNLYLFLKPVLYGFYIIFPPKIFKWISKLSNILYSIWKSYEFKQLGSDFRCQYPIYLHGGKHISIGKNFFGDIRLRLEAWDNHLGFTG